MGITRTEAQKFILPDFGMDPYFPKEARCGEEHVRHMLQVVYPILASYRKVLIGKKSPMPTYTALGMFAVGDTDQGHHGTGHIWLIDLPGKGKTLLAKVPAILVGCEVGRFQGVPDALTADYTGNYIIDFDDEGKRYFRLVKGPGFAPIQLIDEVNRLSPRAQSALLEVLSEGTITIAGKTHKLPYSPFCIFTSNPIETEGTNPVGKALSDRMMFQITGETFDAEIFASILKHTDTFDSVELKQICDLDRVQEIREFFYRSVILDDKIAMLIGRLCERMNNPGRFHLLRQYEETHGGIVVETAISGRGDVHLKGAARAMAAFKYRNFITPDDVYKVARHVLRHRVVFAKGVTRTLQEELKLNSEIAARDVLIDTLVTEAWSSTHET